MVGNTFYGPGEVLQVILGQQRARARPSRSASCGSRVRCSGCCAGFAFGIAGVTFQTMLRNPLASPDIIGISSGASAAAVIGIVVLSLDETAVSLLALAGALADRRCDLPARRTAAASSAPGSSSSASASPRCSTAS